MLNIRKQGQGRGGKVEMVCTNARGATQIPKTDLRGKGGTDAQQYEDSTFFFFFFDYW